MKKSLTILLFLIIFITGCSSQDTLTNSNSSEKSGNLVEDKGIITDKLKFINEDKMSGEIIKNKLTKNAEMNIIISINNTEEYVDFFGERLAAAPMMINMACGLFSEFMNPTELNKMVEKGNLSIESKEEGKTNPLEGYTVTKLNMKFIDFETKENIADCVSTNTNPNDTKYTVYRKYENSAFGVEIGKFPNNSQEDTNLKTPQVTAISTEKEDITPVVVQPTKQEVTAPKVVTPVEKEVIYSMNTAVKVDYLTYTITKAESFNYMGTSMFNKKTTDKFVKVYMKITNNAKQTENLYSARFKIQDSQERLFDRLDDDMMYIDDPLEFGKQLQPGLATSGAIVFELPIDADDLVLVINGDYASTSEAKVKLSTIRNIGKDLTLQEKLDAQMDAAQADAKAQVEELMNQCNAPFQCTSSCPDYMDVGRKDCSSGELCCMSS